MKWLLIILTFYITLSAQVNPKLYASLGDSLFEANAKFEDLQFSTLLRNKVQNYKEKSDSVHAIGMILEAQEDISIEEKQNYLQELRKLQKSYQSILESIQQMLVSSIKNNDTSIFKKICNSTLDDLYTQDEITNKVIMYYETKKEIHPIDSINKLIQKRKQEQEYSEAKEKEALAKSMQKETSIKKETAQYVIKIMPYKDAYGNDYASKFNISFDECRQVCLNESKCQAFLFNNKRNTCWLKEKVGSITDIRYGTLGIKEVVK